MLWVHTVCVCVCVCERGGGVLIVYMCVAGNLHHMHVHSMLRDCEYTSPVELTKMTKLVR